MILHKGPSNWKKRTTEGATCIVLSIGSCKKDLASDTNIINMHMEGCLWSGKSSHLAANQGKREEKRKQV